MLMPPSLVLVVCAGLALGACRSTARNASASAAPSAAPAPSSSSMKIWVSANGDIEVDGKPSDIPALAPALGELAKRKGVVLYGRDAAGKEPHPNAMSVIKLVVANELPLRMSSKRDFSDAIGEYETKSYH